MFEQVVFIVMLSVALAMDAFAVSITLGMSGLARKFTERIKIGLTFGIFQGGLFLLGCYLLTVVGNQFQSFNKVITAILLAILGLKMLKDAFEKPKETCTHENCYHCQKNKCLNTGEYRFLTAKILLIYGTATSIDAFAAGVSYGLSYSDILWAAFSIGAITFVFTYFGSAFGLHIKNFIGKKANIVGGLILIFLAIKSIIN